MGWLDEKAKKTVGKIATRGKELGKKASDAVKKVGKVLKRIGGKISRVLKKAKGTSKITVKNETVETCLVQLNKVNGKGDDSYFPIDPEEKKTWSRAVYQNVEISLSYDGNTAAERYTFKVRASTTGNYFKITSSGLVWAGDPKVS